VRERETERERESPFEENNHAEVQTITTKRYSNRSQRSAVTIMPRLLLMRSLIFETRSQFRGARRKFGGGGGGRFCAWCTTQPIFPNAHSPETTRERMRRVEKGESLVRRRRARQLVFFFPTPPKEPQTKRKGKMDAQGKFRGR
jgi:hypothetical protein